MYWFCIHDIATRQTSELRNGKALLQARTSDTKIRPANGWIQGSERKPRRRGRPAETQEAKLGSHECPCPRQWQNSIPLSSNRISTVAWLASPSFGLQLKSPPNRHRELTMGNDRKTMLRENRLCASDLVNSRPQWKSSEMQGHDNGIEEVVGSIPSGSTNIQ
jgi:hypothetical protein